VLLEGGALRNRRGGARPGVRGAPAASSRPDAIVGARSVLGRGVKLGAGAHVESSVVLDGTAGPAPERGISGSIVGPGVTIGDRGRVQGQVMLGEGVWVASGQYPGGRHASLSGGAATDAAIAF